VSSSAKKEVDTENCWVLQKIEYGRLRNNVAEVEDWRLLEKEAILVCVAFVV
jgi:hypothetical protein